MGDAAGQLPDRLHFLRLQRARPREGEFHFGLALVRDVAGDLGKANMGSLLVEDRVDHHVGPELTAVLALTQHFGFELSFAERRLERLLWGARADIFLGVEFGEVLADDLAGSIALDPFGTRVP